MEKGILRFVLTEILRRSARWLLIEWRFQRLFGWSSLLISLAWSWKADRAEYFSRAGALMSLAGGFMTFRLYLRGGQNSYLRDTGLADQPAFGSLPLTAAKMKAPEEDFQAMRWGVLYIVIGTLVWAYGDLLIKAVGVCRN